MKVSSGAGPELLLPTSSLSFSQMASRGRPRKYPRHLSINVLFNSQQSSGSAQSIDIEGAEIVEVEQPQLKRVKRVGFEGVAETAEGEQQGQLRRLKDSDSVESGEIVAIEQQPQPPRVKGVENEEGVEMVGIIEQPQPKRVKRVFRHQWKEGNDWLYNIRPHSGPGEGVMKCKACEEAGYESRWGKGTGCTTMQKSAVKDHAQSGDHKSALARWEALHLPQSGAGQIDQHIPSTIDREQDNSCRLKYMALNSTALGAVKMEHLCYVCLQDVGGDDNAHIMTEELGQGLGQSAGGMSQQCLPSFSAGIKQINLLSDLTLQEARTWDEGLASRFSTTPLSDIFKGKRVVLFGLPGAFTGVCSQAHVPSFIKNYHRLKEKGADSIVCVSVNDPYTMNAWAERLGAKGKIEFYADFDGKFNKSLGLDLDMTDVLLGPRSQRYAAFIDDGNIRVLHVEKVPSDFKVSDAETLWKSL